MPRFVCGKVLHRCLGAEPIDKCILTAEDDKDAASKYHQANQPSHMWMVSVKPYDPNKPDEAFNYRQEYQ